MLQNYTKVFIKASILRPVPGDEAPDIINKLYTKKKVKSFLKDLQNERLSINLDIGIDHPFWILFLALHKPIIAAGGWVLNPEGKLLVIERNGKLDMPKGKLDFREKIEDCAVREVQEECRVKRLKITGPAQKTVHCYTTKSGFAIKTTFWFPMTTDYSKKLKPQTEEGITDVYWASAKKLTKKLSKMPSYNSLTSVFEDFIAEAKA